MSDEAPIPVLPSVLRAASDLLRRTGVTWRERGDYAPWPEALELADALDAALTAAAPQTGDLKRLLNRALAVVDAARPLVAGDDAEADDPTPAEWDADAEQLGVEIVAALGIATAPQSVQAAAEAAARDALASADAVLRLLYHRGMIQAVQPQSTKPDHVETDRTRALVLDAIKRIERAERLLAAPGSAGEETGQ